MARDLKLTNVHWISRSDAQSSREGVTENSFHRVNCGSGDGSSRKRYRKDLVLTSETHIDASFELQVRLFEAHLGNFQVPVARANRM